MAATPNTVQFSIRNVHWAKRYADGTYDAPTHMPGAETLTVSYADNTGNRIAADGGLYWNGGGARSKTGELQMARFLEDFRKQILGLIAEEGDFITEGDGAASEFAFMFEGDGDLGGERFCWFDCDCTMPTQTWQTTDVDGNITEASETATITAKLVEMTDGVKRLATSVAKGGEGWETFFDKVPFAEVHGD